MQRREVEEGALASPLSPALLGLCNFPWEKMSLWAHLSQWSGPSEFCRTVPGIQCC